MSENEIKPVAWISDDGRPFKTESEARRNSWNNATALYDQQSIDCLTAERDAAVAEVAKMEALVAAAKRARRCLAWACEQRPEFNAEYEALGGAIDAARAEGQR